MILALASVVNYDCQSDAPIWGVTSSRINYDRNKFIIQATDVNVLKLFVVITVDSTGEA